MPPQSVQGYHFPPPEPEPTFGYNSPPLGQPLGQPLGGPAWGEPADPHGYELSYQSYSTDDPSPFHQATPHQQQDYGDQDVDYGDEYFEDEEPRRGRRWLLITAALVGAIGVGGALAYTYRSLVAPSSGRVPVARSDATVKAKPDFRNSERRLPPAEEQPPPAASKPEPPREEPAADTANIGPRVVRPIPITPGSVAAAATPEPPPAVPGITLYRPPQATPPPAAIPPPPVVPASQPPARAALPPAQPPPARVTIGSRPPAAEADEEPAASPPPPPVRRPPPVQQAAIAPPVAPKPPAPPRQREASSSGGIGYVAVLKSLKTSMEALQAFADMQQQYPEVLADKTPDVQSADLSARNLGTMYRLVVGPPGSRTAAQNVCAQLKTAGYEGCWVKEY